MKDYSEKIEELGKQINDLLAKAMTLTSEADDYVEEFDIWELKIDESIRLVEKASKLDKKRQKYVIKQIKQQRKNLYGELIKDIYERYGKLRRF